MSMFTDLFTGKPTERDHFPNSNYSDLEIIIDICYNEGTRFNEVFAAASASKLLLLLKRNLKRNNRRNWVQWWVARRWFIQS